MKKVVVITGASSGFGKEIAKLLLQKETYHLILTGRNEEGFTDFKNSENVTIIVGDITKKQTLDVIEHAVNELKRIDILINNAGITFINPFLENNEQKIDDLLAVNLKAPMLLTQRLYPLMVQQQSGHIININSAAGKEGKPNHTIYSAAKFGLKGFTDALRIESKPHNIRVTGFHPGGINTPLYRNLPEVPKEKYMDAEKVASLLINVIESDPSISPDEIVINRMTK